LVKFPSFCGSRKHKPLERVFDYFFLRRFVATFPIVDVNFELRQLIPQRPLGIAVVKISLIIVRDKALVIVVERGYASVLRDDVITVVDAMIDFVFHFVWVKGSGGNGIQ
jgi:hypothetical protein